MQIYMKLTKFLVVKYCLYTFAYIMVIALAIYFEEVFCTIQCSIKFIMYLLFKISINT